MLELETKRFTGYLSYCPTTKGWRKGALTGYLSYCPTTKGWRKGAQRPVFDV